MSTPAKLSVVLVVRDGENRIVARVEKVIVGLAKLTRDTVEVVVVDDGSRDATPEVLDKLQQECPQVRVVRHSRPRGLEAAGQTGLERATGELVFIQESDTSIRIEDVQRLLELSEDHSVVAARAESKTEPIAAELLRRLRAWGTSADLQMDDAPEGDETSCLQMVRRPHLQRLAGPSGDRIRLQGETLRTASLVN
ncbi:Glycosyl transferase, family 2 domain protein [Rhodopirellula maiorica SM1]|uniref:Glycosyl transferase, family 2 domain protein n=1 Tax=Rhodopirellula maiorica SM1 TaxID=1265738 RepID=M5RPJ4_9BACT|nr:glycosyltransferase [Rhodopirellula maiorica]EMI15879.1 Glycosyl transferase, family 2 domain protein [Rhodopirellula maiorica SM1]